jgi:protein-L-isoaspartate(D-aspartate) O-methyltransferase
MPFANPIKKFLTICLLLLAVLTGSVLLLSTSRTCRSVFVTGQAESSSEQSGADVQQPDNKAAGGGQPQRPDHSHPAFAERREERERMVVGQMQQRDVSDANVLKALRVVPRHFFVRDADQRRAYSDQPLPIGLGQTISQPYIVAYMTEALALRPDSRVLEIGTGSGYQAAVCAEIAKEVFTVEILEELASSAQQRLKRLGCGNVFAKAGDGYFGWEETGPFDAIIITAVAGLVPPPLIKQLKCGGVMILPLGSPFGFQHLVLVTKDDKGEIQSRRLLPVSFVPMTGRIVQDQ